MDQVWIGLLGALAGALGTWLAIRRRTAAELPSLRTAPAAAAPDAPAAEIYAVLDNLVEGVVMLDQELRPVLITAAARRLLGIQGSGVPNRMPSEEVLETAQRAASTGTEVHDEINLWFPLRTRVITRAFPLEDASGVVVLLRDVTEEHMAQQIRREFVAHASHELKSPVASLQTLAEAVRQAVEDDPAAVVRFTDRMVAEAGRLGRLVRDLLDLSRLEDPDQAPSDPADLAATTRREGEHARGLAAAKQMEFDIDVHDVWVKGDEEQLALMVRNLLENAIRYTPEGGRICLALKHEGSAAVLKVSDTGIGIPREAQGRVFERFYRVDKARSRDRGGTGLGLAIVKHVAELHGGHVTVASELGQGSTFTAWLPAIEEPGPQTADRGLGAA